jgi:hypothetical protein
MIGDGLLNRLVKFNERVHLSDREVWAIVELQRFMWQDARRPPCEADIEACCQAVGADATKVMLWFFARRGGRSGWRWGHLL